MQELFYLFYLYDYMVSHTKDEEHDKYIYLRDYVVSFIAGMGAE